MSKLRLSKAHEIAAYVQTTFNRPLTDGTLVAVALSDKTIGASARIEDYAFFSPEEQHRILNDLVRVQISHEISSWVFLGYGPDAQNIVENVQRLGQVTDLPLTVNDLVGVNEGYAFRVKDGFPSEYMKIEEIALISESARRAAQPYLPYETASFEMMAYDISTRPQPPTIQLGETLDLLVALGEGKDAPAQDMAQAAALLTDHLTRDALLLKALRHEDVRAGLLDLYKRSPEDIRGDIATVAVAAYWGAGHDQAASRLHQVSRNDLVVSNYGLAELVKLSRMDNLSGKKLGESYASISEVTDTRLENADRRWAQARARARATTVDPTMFTDPSTGFGPTLN